MPVEGDCRVAVITAPRNDREKSVLEFVFQTKKVPTFRALYTTIGGEAEIRTLGGIAPTTVFKTAALNHSATSPSLIFKVDFSVKTE